MAIYTIFGKPGAGKSTIFASTVQKNKRKKIKWEKKTDRSRIYRSLASKDNKFCQFLIDRVLFPKNFYDVVYSTDSSILDTVPIDYSQLGRFRPTPNSLFLLEEAGLGIDSRQFKTLSKESKRFAAMHRHALCDILICSQSVDIDKCYRQRSDTMFVASKFGPFTFMRKIIFSIDVDDNTHDLVDGYYKTPFIFYIFELLISLRKKVRNAKLPFRRSRIIFRPAWYKYFNSYVDDYDYPEEDPAIHHAELLNPAISYYKEVKENIEYENKVMNDLSEAAAEDAYITTSEEYDEFLSMFE